MTKATLCLIAVLFIVFTCFGPAQTGKSYGSIDCRASACDKK